MSIAPSDKYTNSALRIGDTDTYPQRLVGEFIGTVVSNEWVNEEYKHVILKVHPHALRAYAGQMFHLLCPSPDSAEVWMRRPMRWGASFPPKTGRRCGFVLTRGKTG